MALPSWFSLDAAEVRVDSRLRETQAQADYDEAAFETEIARRVTEYAPLVLQRVRRKALSVGLIPDYSSDLADVLNDDQKQIVLTATKQLVIASLLGGMNDDGAQSRAKLIADGRGEAVIGDSRFGSVDSSLKGLEDDLQILAGQKAGQSGMGASSVPVRRADECDADTEYGHPSRRW